MRATSREPLFARSTAPGWLTQICCASRVTDCCQMTTQRQITVLSAAGKGDFWDIAGSHELPIFLFEFVCLGPENGGMKEALSTLVWRIRVLFNRI